MYYVLLGFDHSPHNIYGRQFNRIPSEHGWRVDSTLLEVEVCCPSVVVLFLY